ncbi:AAA family ATPase [Actimicrobium antarcticum]|uniref:AAA+ ATPase domain-containing protein n=1 Tax=Actimicrobium antarcticum TaxID=1051899 RepID=A0ABP7T3W5_9BURK
MPNFAKLHQSFKRFYLPLVLLLIALLAMTFNNVKPAPSQEAISVVQTQNVAEITALVANRARIEYVLIAQPLADFPRYVFKYKDEQQIHAVKVPINTHIGIEREILLKNGIPYAMAKDDFLAAHASILSTGKSPLEAVENYLIKNLFSILTLGIMLFLCFAVKNGMPGMGAKAGITKPADIKGSMDDLIGMADIKQEVAHLEDMIRNRSLYRAHNIDKPFNVMLSGPAGTGKTRLVGYLAKRLDVALIQASGSGLESGLVGGGSNALQRIYKKACKQGNCIIFLDEAQGLFMPRGRSDKKWEDDTANTLLGLLDGIQSGEGAGVIWVVASNFDDASTEMDEAMLRRFSVKINFRLPNQTERRDILQVLLSRKADDCIDRNDLDLDHVARVTANLSPALLETVVDCASRIAIQQSCVITTDVLVRAFERATIGLTDRATSAEKNRQRERVAIHELGHFLMQIDPLLRQGLPLDVIKARSDLLKISTESVSKLNALGYVLQSADDAPLKTLEDMEQDVIQLYGGVAAEQLFYGERGISVGSMNDIEKATRLLNLMVSRLSMYSRSKLDYAQLRPEGSHSDEMLKQVEAKADELYSAALAAMQPHRETIDALKDVLMERYVLSKEEVFVLLAECLPARCDDTPSLAEAQPA